MKHVFRLILLITLCTLRAMAADWPQWGGPDRNGIAPTSPALLDQFPAAGPAKLWTSEDILGGESGGWGSVTVSGGKAFVFVNRVKTASPTTRETQDSVYCLDANTGKTLWRTSMTGCFLYFPCSTTPAVADGRCYVCNSEGKIFCLDTADGNVLWTSAALGSSGFNHNRSSSVLVTDGTAIALIDTCAFGVDIADGKTLWKEPKLAGGQRSSPVLWNNEGANWVIINAADKLSCVNPKDGKIRWSVACGGCATPSVMGNYAAVSIGGGNNGFVLYDLSPTGAQKLWSIPTKEDYSAPLFVGDHLYAVGGAYAEAGKGKARCLILKDGTPAWEELLADAQLVSPVLADGKIITVSGSQLVVFKANAEKFDLVGKMNLGLDKWCSPTIADGKVFLRTAKNVLCVDLTRKDQ